MTIIDRSRMMQRRRSAADWTDTNEVLLEGEIGIELGLDPPPFKIGDGVTAWNDLAYFESGGGGGAGALLAANNLADVDDVAGARDNLDLGTAAQSDAADFDAAGDADAAVAAHDALSDPHPQYDTAAEVTSAIGTAIAGKADDSAVLHKTGNETAAGIKTFSSAPVVPDAAFPIAKTNGLQTALDAKAPTANPVLTAPTAAGDATTALGLVTKQQLDAAALGFQVKSAGAKAATNAALPACTYANGAAGVGATLTANANGAFTARDGEAAPALNDRYLIKDQAAGLQDGLYALTQVGTGGTPWILTRTTDCDTSSEFNEAYVLVSAGAKAGNTYLQSVANPTVGTTAIVWDLFGTQVGLEHTANKDVAGGYAGLDGSGFVADAEIPVTIARLAAVALKFVPTAVKTANYTAAAGEFVLADTTSAAFAVTLPNAPPDGTRCGAKSILPTTNPLPNAVTINCQGSDVFNRAGGPTTGSLLLPGQGFQFQYIAATHVWVVTACDLSLSALDTRYQGYADAAVVGAAAAEFIRDTMGGALVAGAGISITVDDAGNTITVAAAGAAYASNIALAAGTPLTVTHNLGTVDVIPAVYDTSVSPPLLVGWVGVKPASINTVVVTSSAALPTARIVLLSGSGPAGPIGLTGPTGGTRVLSPATHSTTPWAINADTTDAWVESGLTANVAISAPSGTPVDNQKLIVRVADASTHTLTWNAIFRAGTGLALPTATIAGKTMHLGFIFNAALTKWDLVAEQVI